MKEILLKFDRIWGISLYSVVEILFSGTVRLFWRTVHSSVFAVKQDRIAAVTSVQSVLI